MSGVMEGGATSRETWAKGFQVGFRAGGGWGTATPSSPVYLFITEHLPCAKCIRVGGGKEK